MGVPGIRFITATLLNCDFNTFDPSLYPVSTLHRINEFALECYKRQIDALGLIKDLRSRGIEPLTYFEN